MRSHHLLSLSSPCAEADHLLHNGFDTIVTAVILDFVGVGEDRFRVVPDAVSEDPVEHGEPLSGIQ